MERCFENAFRCREVHIVANEVHELEWTHLESADFLHRPVYCRHLGNSFFVNAKCLAIEWTGYSIDDESRSIRRDDSFFPPSVYELLSFGGDVWRCRLTWHYLD